MKRVGIVVVLLLPLAAGACRGRRSESVDTRRKPLPVELVAIRRGTLVQTLSFNGTVTAWKTANIGPETAGRIGWIHKRQGDEVKAGELLAELDATTLELQRRQAAAALDVAEAAHRDAQVNFERLQRLYEARAVSSFQFEKARLALDSADTQHRSARAALEAADYLLRKATMRAPFTGVVTSRNMEEGDMINPQMGMGQSVLTLMELRRVKVIVAVPAEEIERIHIGLPCRVRVASLADEWFPGQVYSRNLAADPLSKTFQVEISVENPRLRIKAGVFAAVVMETARRDRVLLAPLRALLSGDTVLRYENGRARRVPVRIGLRNEREMEVVSGLREGDLVVGEGGYDLKDGAPITPAGEKG